MTDNSEKQPQETPGKKKRGRPTKFAVKSSSTDRSIARRERIKYMIENSSPRRWSIQVCRAVLATDIYSDYHEAALIRYAELKNIVAATKLLL